MVISQHYTDFIQLNNGEMQYKYKIGEGSKIVILHPDFDFGSTVWTYYNNEYYVPKLLHTGYLIESDNHADILKDTLDEIDHQHSLLEGSIPFYDTGFWGYIQDGEIINGVGINTLLNNVGNNDYSIIFSSCEIVMIVSKNNDVININYYVINEDFPFITIISPFKQAMKKIGFTLSNERIIEESSIRSFWLSPKCLSVYPLGYFLDKEYSLLKFIPYMENMFNSYPNFPISGLEYIIGKPKTGFIDSEYNNPDVCFYVNFEQWHFEHTFLVDPIFLFQNDVHVEEQ